MTLLHGGPKTQNPYAATGITPDSLKGFHRSFPTGVTVVSSAIDDVPFGIAVNAFSSVSIDPPVVLVCVSRKSSFIRVLEQTNRFAVNVLSEEQSDVAMRFGRPGDDKFDGVDWTPAPAGSPWISGAIAKLEATHIQTIEMGTHLICLGEVAAVDMAEGYPLIYRDGQMFQSKGLTEAVLVS